MFTVATSSSLTMVGYIIFLILIFYFLMIRPQKKTKTKRKEMMESLSVGDEIYTAGGILGSITRIKTNTIWLKISDKCEIELLKSSVGGLKANNTDE